MLYYGVPVGQTDEDVAMAFNKAIITGLLREKYDYDGVVCTDWGVITDHQLPNTIWPARAWGVEHLSEAERVLKALEAGVDQFGGESCAHYVVDLVRSGRLSEARVDQSVRRLLRLKFALGLFDNPFVDETQVAQVMGDPAAVAAGLESQKRAMTLLKNADGVLPLSGRLKIYVKTLTRRWPVNTLRSSQRPKPPTLPSYAWRRPGFRSGPTIPLRAAFIMAISTSKSR